MKQTTKNGILTALLLGGLAVGGAKAQTSGLESKVNSSVSRAKQEQTSKDVDSKLGYGYRIGANMPTHIRTEKAALNIYNKLWDEYKNLPNGNFVYEKSQNNGETWIYRDYGQAGMTKTRAKKYFVNQVSRSKEAKHLGLSLTGMHMGIGLEYCTVSFKSTDGGKTYDEIRISSRYRYGSGKRCYEADWRMKKTIDDKGGEHLEVIRSTGGNVQREMY